MKNTTIQEILGVILAANGEMEASNEAFTAATPAQFARLGDLAIRTTPEYNRTTVACNVKLALDEPANGGSGLAADFEIRREENPVTGGTWYKGYQLRPGDEPLYVGFASPDKGTLARRLVGMFVVRNLQVKE